MTAEEFARSLPPLTMNPLPIKPPFVFNGMSARVFPLRANMDTLQQLCNGYLNFVPPEVGRFRAAAPYVMLMVLDYGQLSEAVGRIGWFSQLEVFFSVPVEWYKLVNGNWVFHDWAVITPYIFVNDRFSVPLGRTVYGFPKILATVTGKPNQWIKDPLAPVTLARVETEVFPEAYQGKRLESRVFLEVNRDAPMSNFRIPVDPSSPLMPWTMASNVAHTLGGLGRDALWMAQSMRIFPISPGSNPAFLSEMLSRMMPAFSPGGTGLAQNSINLKQFRRADDPSRICYQALTNGRINMTSFNGGGLMGEERTFLGDLSGGHTVRLYEHASLPIVRTLGLEVDKRWQSGGVSMVELKPMMPFWMDMDLLYEQGDNLAWRSDNGIWKSELGAPIHPRPDPVVDAPDPQFNSAVASAVEAITGPFQFAGTTIRVLPLLAKKKYLDKFLDDSINTLLQAPVVREDGKGEEHVRLSVWARPTAGVESDGPPLGGDFAYVYLAASSYADVTSKTNNVGDWAKYELSFMIPVKWERKNLDGGWEVQGVGMVPAYNMVDGCVAAISRFEVQGIDTMVSTFLRPESVWLQEGAVSVDSKQTLLSVGSEVLPAYGVGQETTMETLLEISHRDPELGLGDASSTDTPFLRTEQLRLELGAKKCTKMLYPDECKVARAMALELLGNETPFALYTLKQFRDVRDPANACYQELVRVPRVLKELFDVGEIEETLVVRIHDFPSLNIVDTLGLIGTTLRDAGSGVVYSAQAVRPFYLRATLDEPLAERLMSRAGTSTWTLASTAFQGILSEEPGSPGITVDTLAETLQDQTDPSRMTGIMFQAKARVGWDEQQRAQEGAYEITKQEVRNAFEKVDPQMVIESALSREWGSSDPKARWRRGRNELMELFDTLPMGGPNMTFAASVIYRRENNRMALRPGTVAGPVDSQPDSANWLGLAPTKLPRWVSPANMVKAVAEPSSLRMPSGRLAPERNPFTPQNQRGFPVELVRVDGPLMWRTSMEIILAAVETFGRLQSEMEDCFNLLSAYSILGLD
ncbi:MAG: hypothetical protein ABI824_14590, partial [Acidobacteriota bacterium]